MKNLNIIQIATVILMLASFTACNKDYIEMPEVTSEYGDFSEFAFSRSECPEGDVIFTTQSEVDSFAQAFPNCTFLNGSLKIHPVSDEDIISLSALHNVVGIAQDLDVDGTGTFDNLTGLHNIASIGRNLKVENNDVLVNLNDLASLTLIGGDFVVKNNAALTAVNLDPGACEQIFDIVGSFEIRNNEVLNAILSAGMILEGGMYGLIIRDNPQLSTCAIQGICEFIDNGGQVTISNNAPGCNSVNQVKAECAANMDCGTFESRSWATNIQSHKTKINWDLVNDAESYKVRYRVKNSTAPWKNKTTTNPHKMLFNLQSSTNYEWEIRTLCPNGWSDWSKRRYFKTQP